MYTDVRIENYGGLGEPHEHRKANYENMKRKALAEKRPK
jgi:hypothetical protein